MLNISSIIQKIVLASIPAKNLDRVKAEIKTTYKMVSSQWERKGNTIDFNFRIPANTNAVFIFRYWEKT